MAGGGQTERQVQRAILEMCGRCFPSVYIHHSPNGAYLGSNPRDRAIRGGALKGDGTKAGFPDLICLWDGGGALLEVKRPKGATVSEDQKASHERLKSINWPIAVVKSIDDAHAFLKGCGAPCVGELQ
jgi:hypothetical protein